MPNLNLPRKLGKEPLVDVVFEVRFASGSAPSEVLPGLLYAELSRESKVEVTREPVASLPASVRRSEPSLRFSPLVRLNWDGFLILVGDENIAIGCKLPYPGWEEFRSAIVRIASIVLKSGTIGLIERYSLKYVDLIPAGDFESQVKSFNWDIRVGSHTLKREIANIRIETQRGATIHAITVIVGAQAKLRDGQTKTGAILDIDSIVNMPGMDAMTFLQELPGHLDKLHGENKSTFFDCLSDDALTSLEPVYA